MVTDLVNWFKGEYGQRYGGIRCQDIAANSSANMASRCPLIVAATFQKAKDLLVENEFALGGMD
jgi:hypothetical protein